MLTIYVEYDIIYMMFIYQTYIYGGIHMGTVPEYTKNAAKRYNEKFDRLAVNLPKGTRERIKNLTGMSGNAYISKVVLDDLERLEKESILYASEKPIESKENTRPDETKSEKIKTEAEKLAELQALVDAASVDNQKHIEEAEKAHEERLEQERKGRKEEYMAIINALRNGETTDNPEKEQLRQESIARTGYDF